MYTQKGMCLGTDPAQRPTPNALLTYLQRPREVFQRPPKKISPRVAREGEGEKRGGRKERKERKEGRRGRKGRKGEKRRHPTPNALEVVCAQRPTPNVQRPLNQYLSRSPSIFHGRPNAQRPRGVGGQTDRYVSRSGRHWRMIYPTPNA